MRSLRRRVVSRAVIATLAGLTLSGLGISALVHWQMSAHFDEVLRSQAVTVAALVELDQDGHDADFKGAGLLHAEGPRLRLRIQRNDGEVIAASPLAIPAAGDVRTDGDSYSTWRDADGARWRAVAIRAIVRAEEGQDPAPQPISLRITVARPLTDLDARLAWIGGLLALAIVLTIAALAVALALLTRQAMSPLDRFAAWIGGITEETLGARLQRADLPSELVPVADRLNHLLAGLDESFQRERLFGTAVAHELRTPIAGLRSTVEVGLRHARPEASYRATLAASLPLISHLQRMVETLLLLGGLDRGQVTAQRRAVDLIPIMRRAWAPLDELALDGGLRLSWDLGRAAPVVTDPDLIAIVVANALQNLVEYATPRSTATVRFTPGASGWSLSFANSAQGLDPSDAERAFDRFWRGDASRTGTGQHCGLGLALCRSIVGHLGGGISARVDEGRFVLTVTGVAGRASSVESQKSGEHECAHHALTEHA